MLAVPFVQYIVSGQLIRFSYQTVEFRQIRYFVAAAEEEHFGRAAARVHISQPPLSQQIQSLEAELGVELFERIGRGVRLTRAGAEFLVHARTLLRQSERAADMAQRASRGEIGRIAIGFIGSLAFTYVPWLIREFRARYPDIGLSLHELTIAQQTEWFADRRLQIGLLRPPLEVPGVEMETVLREPFAIAIPSCHPLASLEPVPVALLRDEPLIMLPRLIGLRYYSQVLGMCHRAGFSPMVIHEISHLPTAVSLVGAGVGLTVVPESLTALKLPGVTFRALEGSTELAETALCWRREDCTPAVNRFVDRARELVGSGLPGLEQATR